MRFKNDRQRKAVMARMRRKPKFEMADATILKQNDNKGLFMYKVLLVDMKTGQRKQVYNVVRDEYPKKGKYLDKRKDADMYYRKLRLLR